MRKNGLQTFAMHTSDQAQAPMAAAVASEIESDAVRSSIPFEASKLDPETVARRYLQQSLASAAVPGLAMSEPAEEATEFRTIATETLPLTGTKTVKFCQLYNKIPIYGSLVTVELDDDNSLLSINSALGEPAGVDPVAKVSPAEAQQIMDQRMGEGAVYTDPPPRLYYYYDGAADRWRLVYIAKDVLKAIPGEDATLPESFDCIVDAHTGEWVSQLPRSQTIAWEQAEEDATDGLALARRIRVQRDPAGKRRLHDPVRNVQTYDFAFANARLQPLPGTYSGNPPQWDGAAISAHANALEVADFLVKELQRNGLDNQGGPLISTINCLFLRLGQAPPPNREWRNAAWYSKQMIYGQRVVNGSLRSYAVAKDVVAHEFVHGLTDNTARLEYAAMPGALNESYSDIFGIIISDYHEPNIRKWNWQLGEDLDATGVPLRDMKDPTSTSSPQPAHMDDYRDLAVDEAHDWGGVHINSGIHNKAAYNLMTSKAGNGRLNFKPKEIAALFYIALTQYLSRTSTFSDSRRGVELAARTLFRKKREQTRNRKLAAIAKAFDDVGIV